MTNEQMIRELRAVAEKYKGKHVFTCETNINLMATDAANRIESLCDEISRQKAEIERIEDLSLQRHIRIQQLVGENKRIKQIRYLDTRAEAVKEFAERLKSELTPYPDVAFREYVSSLTIDNLVKEFTEGEKT